MWFCKKNEFQLLEKVDELFKREVFKMKEIRDWLFIIKLNIKKYKFNCSWFKKYSRKKKIKNA